MQFNVLEEKEAPADETIEMDGKVSLQEQRNFDLQILQRGPWGSPRDSDYSPA